MKLCPLWARTSETVIDRIEIGITYSTENLEILNKRLSDGFQIIGHSTYSYDGEVTELFSLYKPDSIPAPKVETDSLVLATITTIERGETKNNQRPMWRCKTDTGEKVNIFLNVDEPAKDSFHLFEQTGWASVLNEIFLYSEADVSIVVAMRKNGQWWEIVKVKPYIPSPFSDYEVPSSLDEFDPDIYGNKDISEDLGDIGVNDESN